MILKRRIFAFLIDLFVFNALIFPIYNITFQKESGISEALLTPEYLQTHTRILYAYASMLFGAGVLFAFFMSVFECYNKQTLGGMIMRIKINTNDIWILLIRNYIKATPLILFDALGLIIYKKRFFDKLLNIEVFEDNNEIEFEVI